MSEDPKFFEQPPPYRGAEPVRGPLERALRTLSQALVAALVAVPGAIVAANAVAEQAGVEWRVPPGAWIAAAVGTGFVAVVSAVWNAVDASRGRG